MIEVPLYAELPACVYACVGGIHAELLASERDTGYLAHNKTPPCMTLQ